MLFVSKDQGYTFSREKSIADSSVTPHVLCLEEGVVIIYGRPGVHIVCSKDNGETFSSPVAVIGKTLTEELEGGKTYMQAKYTDTDSYSNTFIEKLSKDAFLILYTNLKYNPGDGLFHKATLVRKATIKKEN